MAKLIDLDDAISAFGQSTKAKLNNVAAKGAPEDQLRAPLEDLVQNLAELAGIKSGSVNLVGETTLAHLATRPDYSVTNRNALIGFIEVKAPGKGADPRKFKDEHDKKQWGKLKTLPNLVYTDGNSFSLWQDGKLEGSIVHLSGDVETSGTALSAPPALVTLFTNFFTWEPIAPRNAKQLAQISARLCRLLREEVKEELERSNAGLTSLASEWRNLLFPEATDDQFADGYAQAVTFGLLVARVREIDLSKDMDRAANELRKSNTLIGTALRLLIDNEDIKTALETSLETLARVLNVVDWPTITKGDAEAWLYFYEDFLEVYDNTLRKKTGSYYTPPEVVSAMVRLTDEALRDPALFNLPKGLASSSVTICDPAVGTGTFLLGVLRHIASEVEKDQGAGAVGPAVASAMERIIGFEIQFGPFAVAQLRLIAEMQTLIRGVGEEDDESIELPEAKLYITDTLGDPYAKEVAFSSMVAPIGESRAEANRIKKEQPITVVIGNPPYKNKAKGMGGWVENGSDVNKHDTTPMTLWAPPPEWGVGAHTHHLKNLYVYFWRWAALKVFGSGWYAVTGEEEKDRSGIVCYITVAGFLNGPGFQKMREELRRDCSSIWVIDCSPDGHQPTVSSRIFQGVQQPVCIVLAARGAKKDRSTPAQLKFLALPEGHREKEKFKALGDLSLLKSSWVDGPSGWREPFLPEQEGGWFGFPSLMSFFDYSVSGVTTHRTWVISPDVPSLNLRWSALHQEQNMERMEFLFHADDDRSVRRRKTANLGPYQTRPVSVAQDSESMVEPVRYAYRSFDRQWLPPDHRLISRARPDLWKARSSSQVYVTALEAQAPRVGPAISLTALIPDLDHYKGNHGGRVYPLWRDADASISNIKPAFLAHLSKAFGTKIAPEDMMVYIAAVMAHPGFTSHFASDLKRPGLRLPLTASAKTFAKAVRIGREVTWLHAYGERFVEASEGRPSGAPRMTEGKRPTIPRGGTIPGTPEPLPDIMTYDPAKCRLCIGKGYIDNVTPQMWDYEVSGMNVLRQWFSYRKHDRSRPVIGDRRPPSPLSKIQPDHWLHEYTNDLIDLLNVLGRVIALEPLQADLLCEVLDGALFDQAELMKAGAFSNLSGGK